MLDAIFGGMKDLTLAQECARAVLVFFYGLVMLRLSGRRTFKTEYGKHECWYFNNRVCK